MTTPYPEGKADRQAIRDAQQQAAIAHAIREAQAIFRSIKCGDPYMPRRHANQPDGCKNDGTTCICECHDPKD